MTSLLTFRCSGTLYAVPAELVLEVVELPALSSWPGAPEGVAGVVDYRGELIPILDVTARVGGGVGQTATEQHQLIVVCLQEGGQEKAGLLVEEALELRNVAGLRPLSGEAPSSLRRASPFLLGVATAQEQVVLALDLAALVDFPEGTPAFEPSSDRSSSEVLARRARELSVPLSLSDQEDQQGLVVVGLGGERWGIPVAEVVELAACPPFTPVPGTPPHLLGLAYLRGGLMRLVDIRSMLGLDHDGPPPAEMVVLSGPGMPTGLAVDAILAVASVKGTGSTVPFEDGWLTILDTARLDVREPRPELME